MHRLDRLRALILVADHGSFTAAAVAMRVSPTAISRAISGLEETLGAQLLKRSTRSVRLTERGEAYLERARRALADLDEADREIAGAEDADPHGLLIVSAPVVFGRLHIVPVVTALLARHPRLQVRLTLTDRLVRLVEEGVDVAVRIGALADSSMKAARIGAVRRMLVASPAYLAARGAPTAPAQLRAHDLIAFDQLSANMEWRLAPRAVIRLDPRLATNSADAAIEAALEGCGILRTFDYQVARHVAEGRLVEIMPGTEQADIPVHVVYSASRYLSPNVRGFVDGARAAMDRGRGGARSADAERG